MELTAKKSSQPEILSRSPAVYMFTAPNSGPKTLDGTNTYVVLADHGYVIDPGPDLPAYQQAVAQWARDAGAEIRAILLTHAHPDHAPGATVLKDLLGAVVMASPRISRDAALPLGVTQTFGTDARLPLGGGFEALHAYAAPGHTPDHVVFYQPNAGILFSGDLILGSGSTLIAPPEGDMRLYMKSLEFVAALDLTAIAPGHGPVSRRPGDKIREYIDHRMERETQILGALGQESGTIRDIVERVYADVDPALRDLAAGSVQAQLDKLEYEDRVARRGDVYSLSDC